MPVDNRNPSVRVTQFVMLCAARINESGLLQPLDKFLCCHEMFMRIMRIFVKYAIPPEKGMRNFSAFGFLIFCRLRERSGEFESLIPFRIANATFRANNMLNLSDKINVFFATEIGNGITFLGKMKNLTKYTPMCILNRQER